MSLAHSKVSPSDILAICQSHLKLLNIISDVARCRFDGSPRGNLSKTLERLSDYIGNDLPREEEIMHRTSYPEIDRHIGRHQEFIMKMAQLVYEFEMGTALVSRDTARLLVDWLNSHLKSEDSQFVAFLKSTPVTVREDMIPGQGGQQTAD